VGVDVEQTYASLLEDKLGKKVLNASVTGYALIDYVRVIAAVANTLKPEFVMIGVCLNDVASSSQENIVAMLQKNKRYPNQLVRWLRHFNDNYFNFNDLLKTYSRTYLFVKSLASDTARNYFMADRLYYEDPETVELLSSQFSELQGLLPQGTALVLFIFPYEYQLRARSFETLQPQRIIKEAGGRAGVLIHDLYDELEEYLKINQLSPKSLYLFDDPMHFSSLGHQAIAEIVYRHVKGLPVPTLKQTSSDHLLSISPTPT
jgi:lysophospholipase L1-like esterase